MPKLDPYNPPVFADDSPSGPYIDDDYFNLLGEVVRKAVASINELYDVANRPPQWIPTGYYYAGQVVWYNGVMWRRKTDGPTIAGFDSSNWDVVGPIGLPQLATVASTGSFLDLKEVPDIRSNYGSIFGDGIDGAATLDGVAGSAFATRSGLVYTMIRDANLKSLTIAPNVTLICRGYRLFVQDSLTNNGTIQADGNAGAVDGTGGLPFNGVTLGHFVGGGAGQTGVGSASVANASHSNIGTGNGGTGGSGSTGVGGAGVGTNLSITPYPLRNPHPACTGLLAFSSAIRILSGSGGGGGGGGDGSVKGCGGGSGASVVCILAKTVVNNGLISAKGGTGGAAQSGNVGGGGGGAGGLVLIYSLTPLVNSGQVSVAGGLGGTGSGTGTNGTNGTDGTANNFLVQ